MIKEYWVILQTDIGIRLWLKNLGHFHNLLLRNFYKYFPNFGSHARAG